MQHDHPHAAGPGGIDLYCERTGPEYWSEPINAVTNAAFLVAAAIMWHRTRGGRTPIQLVLVALLAAIGVGSYLFHTHATGWAAAVDVLPIGLYVLAYVFAANRDFWGLPLWAAALGTAAFVPYAALTVPLFGRLPFFEVSAAYWPVPLLIAAYAVALRRRAPATARGLAVGVAILVASLAFRTIDGAVCDVLPVGTHFLWHFLNAVMLGWMIEVHRRHLVRRAGSG